MNIYKCADCGTLVEEIKCEGCHPSCCGHPMVQLVPGSTDAAVEKHVPAVTVNGNTVSVVVGSVEHPMTEAHYIEWIAVETGKSVYRKNLKPTDAPKAEFILSEGETLAATYAYCNLHGLWKA